MPAITIEPIATTVAGEEPDTAANSMQASTDAMASPPGRCPTAEMAKLIMRLATPPVDRKFPARMKNGIANSVKCSKVWKNFSASEAKLSCSKIRIVSTDARPSDMATGRPTASIVSSETNRNAVFIAAPSSRRGGRRG